MAKKEEPFREFPKEMRDYLSMRRDQWYKEVASAPCKYGEGANQLGLTDTQVEEKFIAKLLLKIDEAADIVGKDCGKLLISDSSSARDLLSKATSSWVYIDTNSKLGIKGVGFSAYNNMPSVTINIPGKDAIRVSVRHTDFDEYNYTCTSNGYTGGYKPMNEVWLRDYENYKANPDFEKMLEERRQQKQQELLEQRRLQAVQQEKIDNVKAKYEGAVDIRAAFATDVAKHEYMIFFKNNELRKDERDIVYLNKKFPKDSDEYKKHTKSMVAVNQGYRVPYDVKYEDLIKNQENAHPYNTLTLEQKYEVDTQATEASTYLLAQRLHEYNPNSPLLAQYKQKLESEGKQFAPMTDAQKLSIARYDQPLDNSTTVIPAYKNDKSRQGKFVFSGLQDFFQEGKKKITRKSTALNEAFCPLYRGKNYPPKKVIILEGYATALSALVLEDVVHDSPHADDTWVVSAFSANNTAKVAKSMHNHFGNGTEVVMYADNDEKYIVDAHNKPILDENGKKQIDHSKGNAGRDAIEEIYYYAADPSDGGQPVVMSDGSVRVQPKNFTCTITPADMVNKQAGDSDVNDFDVNLMNHGYTLEQRRAMFKKHYVEKLPIVKAHIKKHFEDIIDGNPAIQQVVRNKINQVSQYLAQKKQQAQQQAQAMPQQQQQVQQQPIAEREEQAVQQAKQVPESAVQHSQYVNEPNQNQAQQQQVQQAQQQEQQQVQQAQQQEQQQVQQEQQQVQQEQQQVQQAVQRRMP